MWGRGRKEGGLALQNPAELSAKFHSHTIFSKANTSVEKQGYFSACGIILSILINPIIPGVLPSMLHCFYSATPLFNPPLIPDKCGMLFISCV